MGWKAWEHPVPLLLQSCSRSAPPLSATSVTQPDGDGKPEMGIFETQTSAGRIFALILIPAIQNDKRYPVFKLMSIEYLRCFAWASFEKSMTLPLPLLPHLVIREGFSRKS